MSNGKYRSLGDFILTAIGKNPERVAAAEPRLRTHLSFSLPESASPWRRTWDRAKQGDPASIAEIDLRYKYFGVNVEMVVDDVEIISKKRFVTLLDLALSLRGVVERISCGEDAAFGLTESEEVISLRQAGDSISVSSSKKPSPVLEGSH